MGYSKDTTTVKRQDSVQPDMDGTGGPNSTIKRNYSPDQSDKPDLLLSAEETSFTWQNMSQIGSKPERIAEERAESMQKLFSPDFEEGINEDSRPDEEYGNQWWEILQQRREAEAQEQQGESKKRGADDAGDRNKKKQRTT